MFRERRFLHFFACIRVVSRLNQSVMNLDAVLSPAEIAALTPHHLRGVTCVVIDVLRATSAMITALANGAEAIIPVASIEEARTLRRKKPHLLLAGERNGFKITGFDLGNSPREMTSRRVRSRTIAWTTTNGTVALRACREADAVYVASLLNLTATVRALATEDTDILFVCAGTHDRFALEDAVCAGAIIERLSERSSLASRESVRIKRRRRQSILMSGAKTALAYYRIYGENFLSALCESENGRRLLSIPSLSDDVSMCAQADQYPLLAQFTRGRVVATAASSSVSA